MNMKKRSTIIGAALIVLGVLTGIALGIVLVQSGQQVDLLPLLRWPQGGLSKLAPTTASTAPALPAGPAAPVGLPFTAADAKKVSLKYGDGCSYRADTKALLLRGLDWNLAASEPTVLILHTHASESYTKLPGQDYDETAEYRTLNTDYNVVALGDKLASLLEQAGIRVLHDRGIHDYPSYNSAYSNSRKSVQDYLRQYPSIQVVLDLHRDAVLNSDGSQYAPTVEIKGKKVAQVMLVVGTNASGMYHPRWEENLAAALKLQAMLEKAAPGITRPTILRAQRFNHDLSDGAMIVEMGTAGNSFWEAMEAVPFLAEALIALMHGATAGSTS